MCDISDRERLGAVDDSDLDTVLRWIEFRIDRQRLAKVKSLLRDPSVSVAEISALCHFTFPEELHRFFRRRTGLTPTQWRERGETA